MKLIVFLLCFCMAVCVNSINFRNNVCKTYRGTFFRPFSKSCFYNPEIFLEVPSILKLRNISYENHTVITDDGYILTMFRIPKPKPKGVVVLVHPLTQENTVWLAGLNHSAVSTFLNAGYEVWLPNWRGQPFSRKHVNPKISSREYWNFSYAEIAIHDYTSILNYIYNMTNNTKLVVFGHSLGSMASVVYASLKPGEAEKLVHVFICTATASYAGHSPTNVRLLTPLLPLVEYICKVFGIGALLDENIQGLLDIFRSIVFVFPFEYIISRILAFLFGGGSFVTDPADIPFVAAKTPQPLGIKILVHIGQMLNNKKNDFLQYDYGRTKNLQVYGTENPPAFPVENITAPIYLMYGGKDTIAYKKDNEKLFSKLPPKAKMYGKLELPEYNHGDFLVGKKRVQDVYMKALDLMAIVYNDSSTWNKPI